MNSLRSARHTFLVPTLSGTLDSWSEVRAAVDDAMLGGARRVVNVLQLKKRPSK